MAEPIYPVLPDPVSRTGSKLNEFITELKRGGLARTNRFAVNFTMPSILGGGASPFMDLRQAQLLVENVQLPSVNLNTIQNRTYGEYRETPYETVYDNINISFYVDREMKVKTLFEAWVLGIQGYDTTNPGNGSGSRNFRYYNEYTTDMNIWVQDTTDQSLYAVALYECYPKTIGSITLDNNSKDIMKMNVTMQYKFWRPGVIDGQRAIPTAQAWTGLGNQNFGIGSVLNPDQPAGLRNGIGSVLNADVSRYNPF